MPIDQPFIRRDEGTEDFLNKLDSYYRGRGRSMSVGKPPLPTQGQQMAEGVLMALGGVRPGARSMQKLNTHRLPTRGVLLPGRYGDWGSNYAIPHANSSDIANMVRNVPDFPMPTPPIQNNIGPAGESFLGGGNSPPSPSHLYRLMRQRVRNDFSRRNRWDTDVVTGRRTPVDAQEPMRAVPLQRYDRDLEEFLMYTDRLGGIDASPGSNVLVPANRTPTQEYTAAQIIQQNPELARHLGLLNAIKGDK